MLNSPLCQTAYTFNSLPVVLQSAASLTSFKNDAHSLYSHANVHAVSILLPLPKILKQPRARGHGAGA